MSDLHILHNENSSEGNTKLRSRRYQLTINNYEMSAITQITQSFSGDKYIYCFEEAPTTGMKHLHVYIELKNTMTVSAIKKLFPTAHIEICKGDKKSNINYITKGGKYENHGLAIPLPEYTYKDVIPGELYDWQKELESLINESPDSRTIHWYYEKVGNRGKSTFCKYLYMKYPNVSFTTATKSADILLSADEDKNVYLLDFPRTSEGFEPYNALEQLKNGFITDSKLKKQSKITCIRPPHVICFANWRPIEDKLSLDRWKIIEL